MHQYGTFNGNPLVMAAAEATLTEVLTDDAYEKLESANELAARPLRRDHRALRPALLHRGPGREGLRDLRPEPLREYRDYLTKVDDELATLAWLYHMNNGVFMTPGVEEEWTLSIAHSEDDLRGSPTRSRRSPRT